MGGGCITLIVKALGEMDNSDSSLSLVGCSTGTWERIRESVSLAFREYQEQNYFNYGEGEGGGVPLS